MTSRTFYLRLSLVVWLAGLVLIPRPVRAQSDARIAGNVRDTQGGVVANAQVSVKNDRTGEERKATTNGQGYFLVGGLKPSMYTIRIEMASFAPLDYPAMEARAGQELALDFELRPAGVQESVTVSADTVVVDMSSARLGVNVSEHEVQALPINGRQMSQLLLQAPGTLNAGTGTWTDIRFSGRSNEENVIKYDGIEGSGIIDANPGVANGEVSTPFKLQASLENVQEFRVESNSYPAEYGTGTGGQVSVITKSGANDAHGSVFEYLRNDKFDAPNYFDSSRNNDGSIKDKLPKSLLRQNQFGGSIGGPLAKNRAFFFGSYEGYRLKAGVNLVEAVPSLSAAARGVPAVQPLIAAFRNPSAIILPGASANPDFDIAQLQALTTVREDAYSGRFDFHLSDSWTSYLRVFRDQGIADLPESVTGRVMHLVDTPANVVWSMQGVLSSGTINDFKIGYNSAKSQVSGVTPGVSGVDTSNIVVNLSGSVANNGIAGQGATSGVAVLGGLVRSNSSTNGRAQPYDPFSLSFIDSISSIHGGHFLKAGGEYRMIRMTTDRLGGTTYSFANINDFLANQNVTIQYTGDLSSLSPFTGATGPRHTQQSYYIGYGQDEWHLDPQTTLNLGLRYEYYTPLSERDHHDAIFDITTGKLKDPATPFLTMRKNNFQPRVSLVYSAGKTTFRGGFGLFIGPGQTEDQIQPIESDRIVSTSSVTGAFPVDTGVLVANFMNSPLNHFFQPRAYANSYSIPERVYQYTTSVQQELPGNMVFTGAYVGSQGRNLFLRSVANQITSVQTNPDPTKGGIVIRQFDIVNADGSISHPFAEIDYKTSGGHDAYNAMQLSLSRRGRNGLTLQGQYTLAKSRGNTSGSNDALTAANNATTAAQFNYDNGFNPFDVRHTLNISALYSIPFGRGRGHAGEGLAEAVLGGWDIGAIFNARSGIPIDVRVTRPDVVYVDSTGSVFANPAAGRSAAINTPGGGASRNVRRPDLIPGVDPFLHGGGLLFLNPAAFAIPQPGTFGNLERYSLHGPNFNQLDMVMAKHVQTGGSSNVEFRVEIFNLLNADNFSNPVGTLPQALPSNALTEANKVQPGQPFTAGAAGTFGKLTSTVGRTVGLGTNRQVQFALRVNF